MDLSFLINRYIYNRRAKNGFFWQFEPYKFTEEPFLEEFILKPGSCFVDVGANIGGWTVPSSKFYAKVFAFEANPRTARVLQKNVDLNHLKNVTVYPFGLGEAEISRDFFLYDRGEGKGQDSFFASHLGYFTTGERILVQIKTLDSFDLKPDVIKIDTEGYEPQVVKGSMETILKHRPILIIETHDQKDVQPIQDMITNKLNKYYSWRLIKREQPGNIIQTIMIGTLV